LDFEIWKLRGKRLDIVNIKFSLETLDLQTSKHTNGGFIHRKVWLSQLEKLNNDQEILFNNINYIENYIKKLEPNFQSKLDALQLKWGMWGITPKK
jgi:hypothetical protein